MSRARSTLVASAAVVMLASACGLLNKTNGTSSTPGVPDPQNAILVSVPADTVYVLDPESGAIAVVATGLTDFQSGYASWAPNHLRIAYGQAGVKLTTATAESTQTLVKGQLISFPACSANGKQIAYGNGDGMFITSFGHKRPTRIFLPDTLAAFSFDWGQGTTIAFEGLTLTCEGTPTCRSTGQSDIYTIHSDGSGLRRLTRLTTASSPKWSADFSRLLFVRIVGRKHAQKHQLWTIHANGTGLARLTDTDNVVAANWSPDGTRLAEVRSVGQVTNPELQVWVGDADGTGMRMVADGILGADATVDW